MAERPTLGVSLLRLRSYGFAWLLLFSWTKTLLWLRHWLHIWVQKPLMRLGIGSPHDEPSVKNEAMDDRIVSPAARTNEQPPQDIAFSYGLVNYGNFCFVNAVLQCLTSVPGFLASVDRALRLRTELHLVRDADDTLGPKLLVVETLVSVLRGIAQKEEELDLELEVEAKQDRDRRLREDNQQRIRRFRSAVSQCTYLVSSAVSRQEQQDAEEFLSFLLELLHDLLRVPAQPERQEEAHQHFLQSEKWFLNQLQRYDPNDPRSYVHAVGAWSLDGMVKSGGWTEYWCRDASIANLGEVRWNHFLRQNASVITDLFSGQTVRGSQCCSCANLTCLHEEQRIISLAIASEDRDQTLAECLEHYRHPEQLTGENRVYCDGYCRAKTTRLTQILLQRVPPVLVLQLQRFKHTSFRGQTEKVDTPVSFPCGRDDLLDIRMNAFFRDEEKRVTFELTAVCAHLGSSIDSGHYVAYVRHQGSRRDGTPSDQWLRIDDEVVAVIDEAMLRKETLSSAYLLFYAQVCR